MWFIGGLGHAGLDDLRGFLQTQQFCDSLSLKFPWNELTEQMIIFQRSHSMSATSAGIWVKLRHGRFIGLLPSRRYQMQLNGYETSEHISDWQLWKLKSLLFHWNIREDITGETSHKHGSLIQTSDPLWWQKAVAYATSTEIIGMSMFYPFSLCHNKSSSGTVISIGY